MFSKRKRQNNFISNPEDPWGPVYDSTLTEEEYQSNNYNFVEYEDAIETENHDAMNTIKKLKELFTQFKEDTN